MNRGETPSRPPQHGAQPCIQLGDIERFQDVVIRAGVQAGDTLFHAVACGQDQHRQFVAAVLTQFAQHVQSVQVRQAQIQDGRVEAETARGPQRGSPVGHRLYGVAARQQMCRDQVAQGGVVLDDQHAHASFVPVCCPASQADVAGVKQRRQYCRGRSQYERLRATAGQANQTYGKMA